MSTPLEQLIELSKAHNIAKYPNLPHHARPKPKYTDKTANGLTKCVIDFIEFCGWQAERISTTGRYIDRSRMVKNVLGQHHIVGSGEWIPGTSTRGSADISATIQGRSVKIEVKMQDKQTKHQVKYQTDVERAGGQYWLVHSFDEFYHKYHAFLNLLNAQTKLL